MLTILDREFRVTTATFDGILSQEEDIGWVLKWYFEINTEGREFDGQFWQPRLYAESLRIQLPDVRELEGHGFDVEEAWSEYEEALFTLYVFEHAEVRDVHARFGKRTGNTFQFELKALGDVHWGEKYGENVPLAVKCEILFTDITVFDKTEKSARERLAAFFHPEGWRVQRVPVGFRFELGVE